MNLLKAASTVSLLTLASRITGLVREQLMASAFGASALTDAFNVAFRIPNLLRRLFAEGAFSQAFVPLLAATRQQEGEEVTRDLIQAVATALAWLLVGTVVLGVAGAPIIVWLMASGLEALDEAVFMTRLMFPYIFFMSMVALAAGVLNTWKRFAVPAATPVLLNLIWIGAAWWAAPWLEARGVAPIYAIASAVVVGGVCQLAFQVPALHRLGLLPRLGWTPDGVGRAFAHPGVKRILRQMAPALLGVSVAQLSLMINTHIASRLAVGSVSWLTYADRLMEFPTALLGVALSVVLLPQLSSKLAAKDEAGFSGLLDWGLRLAVLLALPCAVALVTFAKPLVAVLYHYGRFTDQDVVQTMGAVMGYGLGLMGLIGVKILAPGFYARQVVRTPVKIAVWVLVITQVFNALLVPWLGHAGLALSIGLGALANAACLFWGLRRAGLYRGGAWLGFLTRVGVACAVLGLGLWWAADAVAWLSLKDQPWLRVAWMAACLGGAAVLYFGVLVGLGLPLKPFVRRSA